MANRTASLALLLSMIALLLSAAMFAVVWIDDPESRWRESDMRRDYYTINAHLVETINRVNRIEQRLGIEGESNEE